MKTRNYAVIMAGGKGVRFWPLSRPQKPKQLLKIFSQKTLIKETIERIRPLFRRRQILVVTAADHSDPLRDELKNILPKSNFIVEPQGNNTAPCLGLAAAELAGRDPNAIMTVLPADHWISDRASFCRTLKAAANVAGQYEALVTIGVKPAYPETGYGYILKGKKTDGPAGVESYRVQGFKEKPTEEVARRLIRSGCLWNSGIFAWRVSTFLTLLHRFLPSVFGSLMRIQRAAGNSSIASPDPRLLAVLRREYKMMPNISIDHGVLERAGAEGKVMMLQAAFGWSDVGSWAAVHQMLPKDKSGNAGVGKWVGFRSRDCLVYSPDRMVALLGVTGMVVVDTADALLVAPVERAQEVKDLVEELKRKGFVRYTK
ncbi:MAG: mannose-1-phosphate guanylyltransferase [Deltaproteobacteria bacterium]|nr:mannose-1-phosphate guanylyltransferase [Deltaproteobacteria bacterium]